MNNYTSSISDLNKREQTQLLKLARASIEHGIETGTPLAIQPHDFDLTLQTFGCCFVTLHKKGDLRGCIGSLTAYQPLVVDIVEHAFGAAFRDTRFTALQADELQQVHIEISVLTPPLPIPMNNQAELLDSLVPHVDGLTLKDKHYQSTFLPSVWDQLPDKYEFLKHLKTKAGMTEDYWSSTLEAFRYRTISFGE